MIVVHFASSNNVWIPSLCYAHKLQDMIKACYAYKLQDMIKACYAYKLHDMIKACYAYKLQDMIKACYAYKLQDMIKACCPKFVHVLAISVRKRSTHRHLRIGCCTVCGRQEV